MSLSINPFSRASYLLSGINPIYDNKDVPRELIAASQEATGTTILMTAGSIIALVGKVLFTIGTRSRFSALGMLAYSLVGLAAGTAISTPNIYSFFSNLSKREQILKSYTQRAGQ